MSDLEEPLASLLGQLMDARGTDLHIGVATLPQIRVDGDLRPVADAKPMTPEDTRAIIRGLLSDEQWETFSSGGEIDFSFSWRDQARIRGNAFHQRGSASVALRLMPWQIPSFDALGLPPAVRGFAQLKQGLVLVTGPTGSGKSTTLAAMIDWINENRPVHILTIEDPIEYRAPAQARRCQPARGRQRHRVVPQTRCATRCARTRTSCWSARCATWSRSGSRSRSPRPVTWCSPRCTPTTPPRPSTGSSTCSPATSRRRSASSSRSALTGIVYQRLIPRIGGGHGRGLRGAGATPPVRNLIKEGKTNQLRNQLVIGQREGMQTFEMSLNRLVGSGTVAYEEAASRSIYPKEVEPR